MGDLHSIALLVAFLENPEFREVTKKLPDVIRLIFDTNMYPKDAQSKDENFTERLIRHEFGNAPGVDADDAMLTRFTNDLLKIAQDGGFTMAGKTRNNMGLMMSDDHTLSKALIAFAMKKYYVETPSDQGELFNFSEAKGSLMFQMDRIAPYSLFFVEGYRLLLVNKYFDNSFSSFVSTQIYSYIYELRDWYVQAGANVLNDSAVANRSTFFLGGFGDDKFTGSNEADLLIGNDGKDSLLGGDGKDCLIGCDGNDSLYGGGDDDILIGGGVRDGLAFYLERDKDVLEGGDGIDSYHAGVNDEIIDSDGKGLVFYGYSTQLTGGTRKEGEPRFVGANGITYEEPLNGTVIVYTTTGKITIKGIGTHSINPDGQTISGLPGMGITLITLPENQNSKPKPPDPGTDPGNKGGGGSATIPIIVPRDPNDIVGPQGFGDEHWISSQNPLSYTIHYENQATATAPAQQVTITQTLDSDLNLSSFRLGDFGWGDFYVTVPDNSSFYINRLDLRATKGYMVDVVAGVDVATYEAYWSFTTIDPNTGEIPEDPTIGFLPPDVDGKVGQAYANYTINANADVPTGTVIDAKATIIFITQEPIDTPAISNTLDTQAPESHVEAVANATVESAQFLVRWSGSDVGSAIAGYTVYVSDNGGTYAPWLENTTLTEATYAGQPGHSYAFYTVASDNAGNKEAAPAQADLTIQVTPNANLTDTALPKIASVELPDDSNYTIGQALDITVHFTEKMAVDIAGLSPVINFTIGEHTVNAVYQSGSGTNALVFRHIVTDPTSDFNHPVLDHAIQTNGTTLRDIAGNPLVDLSVTHNLSGNISFWNNGKVMHDITVNIASHASPSDAEGNFSLLDVPVGTNTLTSTLPPDTTEKGTVDLLDAIAILKSIVGLTSLNPYQEIAADFSKSDGVDLNDAIGILKHVVGLPAPTPEWVFLEKSDTIPSFEPITVDLTSDTTVDLVGILLGDVNGSWAA